jgi:hypothetical protein
MRGENLVVSCQLSAISYQLSVIRNCKLKTDDCKLGFSASWALLQAEN